MSFLYSSVFVYLYKVTLDIFSLLKVYLFAYGSKIQENLEYPIVNLLLSLWQTGLSGLSKLV